MHSIVHIEQCAVGIMGRLHLSMFASVSVPSISYTNVCLQLHTGVLKNGFYDLFDQNEQIRGKEALNPVLVDQHYNALI